MRYGLQLSLGIVVLWTLATQLQADTLATAEKDIAEQVIKEQSVIVDQPLEVDFELPLKCPSTSAECSVNALENDIESVLKSDIGESPVNARWRPHFWPLKPQLPAPLPAHKNKKKVTKPASTEELNFDDTNTWGSFERHPCRRICQRGESLSCYYRLVVHNYQRLGSECQRCQYDASACEREQCIYGDGVPTPIMAVNRMLPGPALEICENDTVVVDVLNYLTEATTMHWHGLPMTRTPEMDGAPFTTQYPLQPNEVFRYSFLAERSGTTWYHSHVGVQRALGVAGSFIVRQTRQANRQAHLYDYDLVEHTLMIQDIVYNYDFSRVRNILINGKGRNHISTAADNDARNRYERLRVSPNYRYRMRVIHNGVFDCPIEFSIENHKMLMIATDGNDIVPIVADSFFMGSAERFDFILEANQFATNYWIRVRGYGNCSQENLYQGAVLHYRGAARNELPLSSMSETLYGRKEVADKVVVNHIPEYSENNATRDSLGNPQMSSTNVATAALRALQPLPWPRYTKFITYYSSFGARTALNGDTLFQIDDITYEQPSVSLLQARDLYYEDSYYCNRSSLYAAGRNCIRTNCQCTNVIRLPAYKPIEIVVANYMDTSHPFHMHGYTFRLVGQDVLGSVADLRRIAEVDRRGGLRRLPDDFPAVEKDTVQIPGRGYIIIRFLSNNPGFWMTHCHIELHALQGMVAIFKVGENYQMKRIPPKVRC